MISSELIQVLTEALELLELAYENHANGNFYGASQLARQYEELVESELAFWHVSYDQALELGLVEKVKF